MLNSFDFTPKGIIKELNLLDAASINYKDLAGNGHFGRKDRVLTWEVCDKVDLLKKEYKKQCCMKKW